MGRLVSTWVWWRLNLGSGRLISTWAQAKSSRYSPGWLGSTSVGPTRIDIVLGQLDSTSTQGDSLTSARADSDSHGTHLLGSTWAWLTQIHMARADSARPWLRSTRIDMILGWFGLTWTRIDSDRHGPSLSRVNISSDRLHSTWARVDLARDGPDIDLTLFGSRLDLGSDPLNLTWARVNSTRLWPKPTWLHLDSGRFSSTWARANLGQHEPALTQLNLDLG